jgi:hypothetical protein
MPGFLLLLCREDYKRHESLRTGEDMCGVPGNFIFYEIVRIRYFNVSQHPHTFEHPGLHNYQLLDAFFSPILFFLSHNLLTQHFPAPAPLLNAFFSPIHTHFSFHFEFYSYY